MQRRRFLSSAAALALTPLLLRQAFAAGSANMSEMDHAAMGHGPVDAPPPAVGFDLPSGQPLPAPRLLANQAGPGRFVAALQAAPAELPLLPGNAATVFWAYNGQVPGPAIVAQEGDEVDIAFANHLIQPTTVHWHGMPVPADQDGGPHYPVAPQGLRHYRFTLPADSAASYWYHPHPHGLTGRQAYMGLAGVFVVKSKQDPLAHLPEQWLVLSDLKLDTAGQIAENSMADRHDGREGQFVLVNGAWRPLVTLAEGERRRWRVWNATSARILRIAVPAHDLMLVGTDGGLIAAPQPVTELLLSPGERAEVVITGRFRAGQPAGVLARPYHRGKAMSAEQTDDILLASLERAALGKTNSAPVPGRLRDIQPLPAPQVRRELRISENMADMNAMFLINGKTFDMNRADFTGKAGEVEEWTLISEAHMDHPFHIHGTRFQVTARTEDGVWREEPFLAWRDVVNVPAGESVRLRLRFERLGLWMYHCHILEHEDAGMMGMIKVEA